MNPFLMNCNRSINAIWLNTGARIAPDDAACWMLALHTC
jgi:hypothetical protein